MPIQGTVQPVIIVKGPFVGSPATKIMAKNAKEQFNAFKAANEAAHSLPARINATIMAPGNKVITVTAGVDTAMMLNGAKPACESPIPPFLPSGKSSGAHVTLPLADIKPDGDPKEVATRLTAQFEALNESGNASFTIDGGNAFATMFTRQSPAAVAIKAGIDADTSALVKESGMEKMGDWQAHSTAFLQESRPDTGYFVLERDAGKDSYKPSKDVPATRFAREGKTRTGKQISHVTPEIRLKLHERLAPIVSALAGKVANDGDTSSEMDVIKQETRNLGTGQTLLEVRDSMGQFVRPSHPLLDTLFKLVKEGALELNFDQVKEIERLIRIEDAFAEPGSRGDDTMSDDAIRHSMILGYRSGPKTASIADQYPEEWQGFQVKDSRSITEASIFTCCKVL